MNANERAIFVDAVVRKFKRGKTTGELSLEYGMTRQGIHNVLRSAGVSSEEGGRMVKSRKKAKRVEIEKAGRLREEKSVMLRFGCTLEQWELLRAMSEDAQLTPITFYSHNRSYANRVKIPWNINLWDWWTVWKDSGHFEKRGRRSDEYCMIRKDESKPFENGNVEIVRNDRHYRELRKRVAARIRAEKQQVSTSN